MNIQRKYSLPNCTLVLEGLSDAAKANNLQEVRPPLSILVNAECRLSGVEQPIAGGRDFFESLVRAVSAYAQEFLSNVSNPQAHNMELELVQLEKVDSNQHRLIVRPDTDTQGIQSSGNGNKSAVQVYLNTVQLFDLVEAVDQFFADSQTLPGLSLELQPVAKRYGGATQALLKQAVPAGVGVTSLAAAAVAFGMLPVPEFSPSQQQTKSNQPGVEASASPSPKTPTTSAQTSPTPTPTTDTASTNKSTPVGDLEALLKTVPEINNPSQLRALNRQVYNQINPKWNNRGALKQDLIYRVGVAADGAIVGYKAVNKEANTEIEGTPLPQLLYNPANQTSEPIAQFRVVFRKNQILEVSPWNGYTRTPDVVGTKITDVNQVKQLRQKLYDNIRENWGGTPTYKQVLKYRVAVKKDGIIADYEPLNQVAFDHFRETPLPKMFLAIYGSNVAAPNNKEPLAHYQVEFSPSGNLDVKPWRGYR
ncbi:MAG: DUF4335 domain-containing protein [Calothrix sp. MO_192.B10]|nr:DUF4335 domain-containing protein [Calothrix sp. MO_192.B10]